MSPLTITEITDPAAKTELLRCGGLDIMIAGKAQHGCFHAAHNDRHSVLALASGCEVTVWELTGDTKDHRKEAAARVRATLIEHGATLDEY